jgi:hypothetical protein
MAIGSILKLSYFAQYSMVGDRPPPHSGGDGTKDAAEL